MCAPSGIQTWDLSGTDSLLEFENTGFLDHSASKKIHLLTCNSGQPATPNVLVLQPDPSQSVPRMESLTFILHALLVNYFFLALKALLIDVK